MKNIQLLTEQPDCIILSRFQKLEQLLIRGCRGYSLFADEHDVDPAVCDFILPAFMPRGPNGPKVSTMHLNLSRLHCYRI